MSRRRRFVLPTLAGIALLSALASLGFGGGFPGDGWLYDLALATQARLRPPAAADAPVAVVAVDAKSLDSPELAPLPRALFSPAWAQLLNALSEAGARAVGFDLVLAYSGNSFQSGYDREFQSALYRHRDKVVLGRSASTLPARSYLGALRLDPKALGSLELNRDPDGVYRRVAAAYGDGDAARASMTTALLARAGAPAPPETIVLAPGRHLEAVPSYSLIDVLRCAEADPAALRAAFDGRVVLVGSVLAEEDRVPTSARYLPAPAPVPASRSEACALAPLGASVPGSPLVPGVHLHAAAVEAALTGRAADLVPLAWQTAAAVAIGILGAAFGLALAPWTAVAGALALAALTWAAEVALVGQQIWLPAALPMTLAVLAALLAYLVRYLVEERRRLAIQRAFGRYLAPSVVAELADNPGELKLGGTVLPVSIMFADLSGFTRLSTTVGPEVLVTLTNRYLAIVADLVDSTGGYVDKYIGDAVMAIWGAPVPNPGHAEAAVRAAMAIRSRIDEAAAAAAAAGEHAFGIKIGLHSGEAVVGNVGSTRRYNYTAVGETVNVASRMESLPGIYDCTLLIGPASAASVADDLLLREIDRVEVKGRSEPLAIFEPIARREHASEADRSLAARYGEALALYRARDFAAAAGIWESLTGDGPSAVMAARARVYDAAPPPEDWNGVFVMTGK